MDLTHAATRSADRVEASRRAARESRGCTGNSIGKKEEKHCLVGRDKHVVRNESTLVPKTGQPKLLGCDWLANHSSCSITNQVVN